MPQSAPILMTLLEVANFDRLRPEFRCSSPTEFAERHSRRSRPCAADGQHKQIPGFRVENSPFGGIQGQRLGRVKEGVIEAMKAFSYVKTFSLPW